MFAFFIEALNDFEKKVYHNKATINNIMTEIVLTEGAYIGEVFRSNFIEIANIVLGELVKDNNWKNIDNNTLYVKKKICTHCKEFKCYSRCESCRQPYCSKNCQKLDWKSHKLICNSL